MILTVAAGCVAAPQPTGEPAHGAASSPPPVAAKAPTPLETLLETQSAKSIPSAPKGLTMTQSESDMKKTRAKGMKISLSAQDADIKTVLMALSRQIKQNITIDPEIEKKATVDLKNVTLEEALEHLLKPLNLRYEMEPELIRVLPQKMETRMFRLNYVITRRIGTSSLQASAGSGVSGVGSFSGGSTGGGVSMGLGAGTGTGMGMGTGGGAGRNQRTSTSLVAFDEADLWREIDTGIRQILGLTTQAPGTTTSPGAAGGVGGVGMMGLGTTQSSAAQQVPDTSFGTRIDASSPTERGYFSINRLSGIIVVKAFPETLLKVAEFIEAIEGTVQRQVFIQARVFEVFLNKDYQLGIDWAQVNPIRILDPKGTTTNTLNIVNPHGPYLQNSSSLQNPAGLLLGVSSGNFNLVVDALSRQGNLKVLSSPKIATLNNQRAVIKVGQEDIYFIPLQTVTQGISAMQYSPETVTIGLVLDVLPQINPDGNVMMSINTSISERIGTRTSPDGISTVPILDVRESNSVVMARNGQTIVLGGMIKDRSQKKTDGVPLLENIPFLGKVFQKETNIVDKTELVIMLTPEIMAGAEIDDKMHQEKKDIKSFGFPAEERTTYQSLN